MLLIDILILSLSAALCIAGLLLWYRSRSPKNTHPSTPNAASQEQLQSSVLAQIAARISYTLDADQIVEVMAGSIDPLLPYATASFVLMDNDARVLQTKIRLREPVSSAFVQQVRDTTLEAFRALAGDVGKGYEVKETILGGFDESGASEVGSYFNLPVVLEGKLVALINISSPTLNLYTDDQTAILYRMTSLASDAVGRLRKVIHDEQRRMDAMVSSLPIGLFMVDHTERLVVVNGALKSWLQIPPTSEMLRLSDLLEKTREMFNLHDLMRQAQEKKAMVSLDKVTIGTRTVHISAVPVIADDTSDVGIVVSFEDTTAEQQLEHLREQFTAMLVHELRSPLTSIRWQIEALADAPRASKQERQAAATDILSVTNRLLSLVNDLLDAAKIEAGKFDLRPVTGSLNTVIQESIKTLEPSATAKHLKIKLTSADLPAFSFDPDRLRQVVINLLSNAIKFTDEGTIEIRTTAEEQNVRVEVLDNGNGVLPEDQPKLFHRFQQLSRGGLKEAGTGLGLVIIKGIIEAHGGTVGYTPNTPQGSIFWFTLPLSTASTPDTSHSQTPPVHQS